MTAPQSVLRRFTTTFHPRSGELLVYGSFAAGGFCCLLILTTGDLSFLAVAGVCFICSFYFQPFLDTGNAQIGADTRGLYIRRLGYIPWKAVEAFRVRRDAVRSVEKARLQIKLRDDWRKYIECERQGPVYRRYMFRTWRKLRNNIIEVRLEHMKDDSRTIENSITEIWQNRPVSSQGMAG